MQRQAEKEQHQAKQMQRQKETQSQEEELQESWTSGNRRGLLEHLCCGLEAPAKQSGIVPFWENGGVSGVS